MQTFKHEFSGGVGLCIGCDISATVTGAGPTFRNDFHPGGGRSPDGKGGFNQSFFGSRYLDRLGKRDGVWRISDRKTLLEFAQQMPSSGGPDGGLKGLELVEGLSPAHALYRRMARR